ncbi:hypothetical protein KCP74_10375 [Salmonella enterica subsp. enterica]|nr:hypothetical protein KCP74_10375 [Salmonella enterica subsp. enterica]
MKKNASSRPRRSSNRSQSRFLAGIKGILPMGRRRWREEVNLEMTASLLRG